VAGCRDFLLDQLRAQEAAQEQAGDAGPYESDREAHRAAIRLGGPARPGWSILSDEQNARMLIAACEAAGVRLGSWDLRILSWLAGFEDSTCAVVAGLIIQASVGRSGLASGDLSTVLAALADAAEHKRERAARCPDCDARPTDLCLTCERRLAVADEYDALAASLRGDGGGHDQGPLSAAHRRCRPAIAAVVLYLRIVRLALALRPGATSGVHGPPPAALDHMLKTALSQTGKRRAGCSMTWLACGPASASSCSASARA
jgi:hypothetical protein